MAYESLIAIIGSPWLYPLLIWALVWKGLALWKSARNKHLVWFIFILLFNTLGILPIVYLSFVDKKTQKKRKK